MLKFTNLQGDEDIKRVAELWMDPSWPCATLDTFIGDRLDQIRQAELERQLEGDAEAWERKVVSVRLSVKDIHYLDEIAKKLGDTRSGLATEILEIGIEELRAKLSIPRVYKSIFEGDGQTTVLRDGDTGQMLGSFEDDALQIGGGDQ